MKRELKPCPFCGSTDIRLIEGDEYCWCMNQRCPIYDYEIRIDKWESRPESTELTTIREQVAEYEEAARSRDDLVRQLDVIWNGEQAATQVSLCDMVSQLSVEVPRLREQVRVLRDALALAKGFIKNGLALGYITPPELGYAAYDTLHTIYKALERTKPKY